MDILFAVIAFLFMVSFLMSIRAIVNKDGKTTILIIFTSLLFGGLFWLCLYIVLHI